MTETSRVHQGKSIEMNNEIPANKARGLIPNLIFFNNASSR